MEITITESCVNKLNDVYYQTQFSPPTFTTTNGRYCIYLNSSMNEWILADINPTFSSQNIHYYICQYNPNFHNDLSSFQQSLPLIGWKPIAAHTNIADIIIKTNTKINTDSENIKLCIYAKKIIIEPNNIIHSGFLLINTNNVISNVGKTTSKIKEIYNESRTNCNILECDILCPGLIDIHNHGIGGDENVLWYYKNPKYTASKLPSFGTTSFLSTVVFSNEYIDDIISMCTNQLSSYITNYEKESKSGAICEGIHCEGPIIADYGGLPNSSHCINKWSIKQFEQFIDTLKYIKIMTISPSIDHKSQFERMKILRNKNVIPALGHDKQCNERQIIEALCTFNNEDDEKCSDKEFEKNRNKYSEIHMTHCFNVQRFHHRNVGLANFALTPTLPNMEKYNKIKKMPTIEIIGDLCHISPILIEAILNSHKPDNLDRIVFITDGIAEPTPDKRLIYNKKCIHVDQNGTTVIDKEKNVICGSCCDMLTIFKYLINIFGIDIDKVVGMCSTNAAKLLKMENKIGTLKIGTRADLILMDKTLNLLTTIVNGNIVFDTKDNL